MRSYIQVDPDMTSDCEVLLHNEGDQMNLGMMKLDRAKTQTTHLVVVWHYVVGQPNIDVPNILNNLGRKDNQWDKKGNTQKIDQEEVELIATSRKAFGFFKPFEVLTILLFAYSFKKAFMWGNLQNVWLCPKYHVFALAYYQAIANLLLASIR